MKIEKLPSGSYRFRKTYRGKTYSVVTEYKPTQKEALELILKQMDRPPTITPVTFCEASESFIQNNMNILSQSTIREYIKLNNKLPDWFCSMRCSDICATDVQGLVNQLSGKLSPKSVRNYYSFVKTVLKFANREIDGVNLPQKQKARITIPSSEDIRKVIQASENTQYEIPIKLACYGLRRSEILALSVNDLNGNRLTVNKALVQDHDKNWVIKSTKTTESNRTILISEALANKIRYQGYVYRGCEQGILRFLTRTQKELGLEHFSLHSLRHFYVSYSLNLGIDSKTIQYTGGWSTDYTMKTVYAHLLEESLQAKQEHISANISNLFCDNSMTIFDNKKEAPVPNHRKQELQNPY